MKQVDLQLTETGLINNAYDAILHSFIHLYQYKIKDSDSDIKWAIISIVQAGELICNALLIKGGCPTDKLVRKETFYTRTFNQELLNLLQKYCKQSLTITDKEIELLRNVEQLANTRNELMHRTLSPPDDKIAYAKGALTTLLIFENRYRYIAFPESELEESTIDQEVVALIPWLGREKREFFKQVNEYLNEHSKQKSLAQAYLNCPQCGEYHVVEGKCRVCRASLDLFECLECGYESYELSDNINLSRICYECNANH